MPSLEVVNLRRGETYIPMAFICSIICCCCCGLRGERKEESGEELVGGSRVRGKVRG